MHRVLLVKDNWELLCFLKELLDKKSFNMLITNDEEQILDFLDKNFDLLAFNILISKKENTDILQEFNQMDQMPVIMLITPGNKFDHLLDFTSDSDTSFLKTFNNYELITHIRAILHHSYWNKQRKNNKNDLLTLKVDLLSLNPGKQEATFNGQLLELTGTEFTLLYLLAKHLGHVVSREYLSQEVLGKRLKPFDRAIDMHISNLRRKLPKRQDGHPWFKTLRGRGYLMISNS